MKVNIPEWIPFKNQNCTLGNHEWNMPRLAMLSADFEVMDIPLVALNLANTSYSLEMRTLVMHMRAVIAADMSKPIILDESGEILDGRHRIMKALLEGHETIKAVRFDVNPCPCRVNDSE